MFEPAWRRCAASWQYPLRPRQLHRFERGEKPTADRAMCQTSVVAVFDGLALHLLKLKLQPRTTMRTLKLLIVPLLAALFIITGCASDRAVVDQANSMHSQLEPAVMDDDPALSNYLQKVGDRIIATAQELHRQGYAPKASEGKNNEWMFNKNMKFHFVNSDTMNAFTT